MQSVTNIRMSGLGGQGVVTAAHILGSAATSQGFESTVNPFFGAEKRLAPAESYVRISKERIYERGEILSPSIIMIFHPHVITMGKCYTMPFFDGLQENGIILINSDDIIEFKQADRERLKKLKAVIYYLSATEIASKVGGTELSTNMAMLGGLLGITSLVDDESFEKALTERFSTGKFVASATTAVLDDAVKGKYTRTAQLIEKNMEVVRASSKSLKEYKLN
ncbi:MAG: 2-oxoacid:acceptor oxidoreductase family protein [Bacillota bacterium]